MRNFRASDMPGRSPAPEPVTVTEPGPLLGTVAPNTTSAGVPIGTVPEILEWVGDDKDRARAALDAETATGSPRKGLSTKLNEILDSDD